MSSGGGNEKQDLNAAYGNVHSGVTGALSGVSIFARHLWNMQMRLLQYVGLMRFFKANWWLFLVFGFLLLAFVMPLGTIFVVTAFAASQMDPKAEDDFIVPLRHKQPTLEDNE